MNGLIPLFLFLSGIIFHSYLIPIFDQLTEFIQICLIDKQMRINVKIKKNEKIVNDIMNPNEEENLSTRTVGFQVSNEDDMEEDEENE